jgi:hypothetical protein
MIAEADRLLLEHLFGKDALSHSGGTEQFSYISNPDGTIRWLYPADLKTPHFLSFYSTASLRAKILSLLIKTAFFLKQGHRVKSGDIVLHIADDSRLGKILKQYEHSGYSIFTGTVGENRKAVVELHTEGKITSFVKIALTRPAEALVANETACLEDLGVFDLQTLTIPRILGDNRKDTIVLSNIKPERCTQETHLSELHMKALEELYRNTCQKRKWQELETLQEGRKRL